MKSNTAKTKEKGARNEIAEFIRVSTYRNDRSRKPSETFYAFGCLILYIWQIFENLPWRRPRPTDLNFWQLFTE